MILRIKFIIPIAIVASAFATFGLYKVLLQQNKRSDTQRVAYRKVVVANRDLPMGKKIEASDLKTGDWPENIVPAGSFSKTKELFGRVVNTESKTGEAVIESKLAPKGSEGGFSSIIPAGMRALTVSVNNSSGVGGFILPNTRVDVLVTVSSPVQKGESTTKIILEDIKVLAVDQTFERKEDDPVIVQTVTLLVTPEDAEKLVLASTEGKLQLSLRNTSDRSVRATSGVRLKELVLKHAGTQAQKATGSAGPLQPADDAQNQKVVEIIRSSKRAEVTFENGERKREKRSHQTLSPAVNGGMP
jgi:pilus assembly protein CpaB